jgi:GAF domain-containing protein
LVQTFADQAAIAIENARLLNELRQRTADLTESLEQQTATADVLRIISSSPGELTPVFQTMLENATRICEAKFGMLFRLEDGAMLSVASLGVPEPLMEFFKHGPHRPSEHAPIMRVARTKQPVHVLDFATERAYLEGSPVAVAGVELGGVRTNLVVPLLKENELIGAFAIYRQEVRPFTDKQIELARNFAAQAVIAIENTRLLNELRESLEQQTATSEVLRVISSSQGELEPVFQAMLESATRICEARFGSLYLREGDGLRAVALHGAPPAFAEERRRHPVIYPGPTSLLGRTVATKRTGQIADVQDEADYAVPSGGTGAQLAKLGGARSAVVVPMVREDEAVGAIVIYRQEVRPFSDKQVELLTNFARPSGHRHREHSAA